MAEQPQGAAPVPEEVQSNVLLTTVDWIYNTGRTFSLWPMTFGLACCAIEFIVTGAARYDMSRFGMEVARPSPRQCDLLIISGTVTKKMVVPIVRLYNQMAEPRYVVSMGACATGGGPFKEGYNVVSGIDKYLPVDVYVPGCRPRPKRCCTASLPYKTRSRSSLCARCPGTANPTAAPCRSLCWDRTSSAAGRRRSSVCGRSTRSA